MSYLPSFLSTSMRWSKVSEKYWKSAFCLWTSSPRMRLRNLVMEQSGCRRDRSQAVLGHLLPCLCPGPTGTHPSPRPGSQTETPVRQCRLTAGLASCLQEGPCMLTPRRQGRPALPGSRCSQPLPGIPV